MRVLITGAAGKIGKATTQAFIAAGHDVVATDTQYRADLPFRLRLADLCDTHAVYDLMEGVDAVVHLGNIPHAYSASPAQRVLIENNTINTNVFTALVHMAIGRVVFVSSIQAISNQDHRFDLPNTPRKQPFPYLPTDGHEPLNPGLNLYGLSKSFGEQTLQAISASRPKVTATSIRFPFVAGSEELGRRARHVFRPGDGHFTDAIAYLYVEDAASLLLACAEREAPGYRVYLPCQSVFVPGMSARALAEKFCPDIPLRPAVDEIDSLADIRRITAETGWTPSRPRLAIQIADPT